jgi:putative ABC transport system ATP-binding protein
MLLADEPTGNLDTRSSDDIVRILQGLNQQEGLTVVIITHEPDIAAATRRIISMRDGQIIEDRPLVDADRVLAAASLGRPAI